MSCTKSFQNFQICPPDYPNPPPTPHINRKDHPSHKNQYYESNQAIRLISDFFFGFLEFFDLSGGYYFVAFAIGDFVQSAREWFGGWHDFFNFLFELNDWFFNLKKNEKIRFFIFCVILVVSCCSYLGIEKSSFMVIYTTHAVVRFILKCVNLFKRESKGNKLKKKQKRRKFHKKNLCHLG